MDPLTASLFSQNDEEHLAETGPASPSTSNLRQLEAPAAVCDTASRLVPAKINTAQAGSAGNQDDALHPLSPLASSSVSSLHSSTGTEHASPLVGGDPQPDAQKPSSSADDLHKGRWRSAQDAERAVHSLNGRQALRPSRQLTLLRGRAFSMRQSSPKCPCFVLDGCLICCTFSQQGLRLDVPARTASLGDVASNTAVSSAR